MHEITLRLWEQGKDPFTQRRADEHHAVAPDPWPDAKDPIRLALRESPCTMAEAREVAQPTDLAIAQGARGAAHRAIRLDALPMFRGDSSAEAYQSWTASEEGAAWRANRLGIFNTSAAGPAALGDAALADDLEELPL